MSLKKIQDDIDEWVNQFKIGYWEPLAMIARLSEETGELAREINHRFGPKKKKSTEEVAEIEDEIADIIITVTCIANSLNLNLDSAMERAMNKLYGRDQKRFELKD